MSKNSNHLKLTRKAIKGYQVIKNKGHKAILLKNIDSVSNLKEDLNSLNQWQIKKGK